MSKFDACLASLNLRDAVPVDALRATAAEYAAQGMEPAVAMQRAVEDQLQLAEMEQRNIVKAVRAAWEAQGGPKKVPDPAPAAEPVASDVERDPRNGYAQVTMQGKKHFITPYDDQFVIREKTGSIARSEDDQQLRFANERAAIDYANANSKRLKPVAAEVATPAEPKPAPAETAPAPIQAEQEAAPEVEAAAPAPEPETAPTPAKKTKPKAPALQARDKKIAEKAEEAKPAAPISDFGDKLEGARKDRWAGFKKGMAEELPEDAKDITLSKHFPEPNYEAMLDDGADMKTLALLKAVRDEIPAKPKVPYKLRAWADKVRALREMTNRVLDGQMTADQMLAEMRKFGRSLGNFADRIELYAELGYPLFTLAGGYTIEENHYSMFDGKSPPGGVTKFALQGKNVRTEYFDSRDQAVNKLRARLMAEDMADKPSGKTVKLDLYRLTGSRDIIIGKKVAANKYIDLKTGFKDVTSARTYLAEHEAELIALLEKKKDVRPERRSVNSPRVGVDRRQGEDITPEKFGDTFGFRGVQFGNYVEQKRRAVDLNNAYDALLDMADLLGVPPRALSLNGTLGLAFGARGAGGKNPAAAHFEPDTIVINLTKTNGAGSLAHEWFHAFDNYFERMRGATGAGHVTDKPTVKKVPGPDRKLVDDDRVRPEVLAAVKGVMDAIRASGMVKRSAELDGRRTKDYWSTPHELAARAFESYIIDKAAGQEQANDYLANIVGEEAHNIINEAVGMAEPFPYPTRTEAPAINAAFDNLFDTVETRKEGDRDVFYSMSDTRTIEVDGQRRPIRNSAGELVAPDFEGQVEFWKNYTGPIDEQGRPIVESGEGLRSSLGAFYSALARTIPDMDKVAGKDGMIQPAQAMRWLAARQKEGKFKADEIAWSGLNDWLAGREGKVSIISIEQFVASNGVQVQEVEKRGDPDSGDLKYQQYALPGGENYRELLLTLPEKKVEPVGSFNDWHAKKYGSRWTAGMVRARSDEYRTLTAEYERDKTASERKQDTRDDNYTSSHWDEKDIVAHVRFNDRTDADGKRVLFIEELQSDWGQEGLKKGFREQQERRLNELLLQRDALDEQIAATGKTEHARKSELKAERESVQGAINELGSADPGVPKAPFITDTKSWLSLGIKRMIRYAAENGYDKIAFVNGQQSADRYDLSKQVDQIRYAKRDNGTYDVWAADEEGRALNDTVDKQGLKPEQIEDFVGKEVAKKIVAGEGRDDDGDMVLEGVDLKVGGEGMKTFYDKIVPQTINEVLKKLGGGRAGTVDLVVDTRMSRGFDYTGPSMTPDELQSFWRNNDLRSSIEYQLSEVRNGMLDGMTFQEAMEARGSIAAAEAVGGEMTEREAKPNPQTGFDITDDLREKAMGGLPLFAMKSQDSAMDTQIAQAIQDGITVDALLALIESESGNADNRALATALRAQQLKTKIEFGTAQGNYASGTAEQANASYRQSNDTAYLHRDGGAEQSMLHELVHAATLRALGRGGLAARQIKELHRHVKDMPSFKGFYGITDPEEFIAEALTSQSFRQQLMDTPAPGVKLSVWQKLVGIVRMVLGLPAAQENVLSRVMALAPDLMAENQAQGEIPAQGMRASAQWASEAFRNWFGSSKVVNERGEPLVVYHGTGNSFAEFNSSQEFESGDYGAGFYFTSDDALASGYAKKRPGNPNVMPVYVSIQNPYFIDIDSSKTESQQKFKPISDKAESSRFALQLQEQGYDGIIVRLLDTDGNGEVFDTYLEEIIAFRPEQIKSATGNNGNFDGSNPDIRASMPSRMADAIGNGLSAATLADLPKMTANRLKDFRNVGLQFLGRRQLVDLYADQFKAGSKESTLKRYSDLMQQMDADKNEAGAEADGIADRWGKLKDADKLADLMHDSTLAQIDPTKGFIAGDDKAAHTALQQRLKALSPDAQAIYVEARDAYHKHWMKVRAEIRNRIERAMPESPRRAKLLEKMDATFYEKVKGVYFPLARFGDYVVTVSDANGARLSVNFAETTNEAEALRRELLKKFPAAGGHVVSKITKKKEFNPGRDAVSRGFMQELFGVLDQYEDSAELQDDINQLYLQSMPDLSWTKHGIHRKGTPGYSQDARRAFAQNLFHGARYLAKLRYGDRLADFLDEMQDHVDAKATDEKYDSVRAQQVVDEMVKRHDAYMNPKGNQLSNTLTSLGFIFYLGLSPASAVVNLTQTPLVTLPMLAAKHGFGKASAALLAAAKQTAGAKNDISKVLTGDELRAYQQAVDAGVIDVSMAHDLAGIASGDDTKAHGKLRPVMKWASFMFHHGEKFNRQASLLAAYRLARDAGQGHDAAYKAAVEDVYASHFDYSSGNRARVMQGPVARVVLLFKQYAQNMVYTLTRNAVLATKGDKVAQKTLAGLLISHAMAAGVLGLPVVGTLLSAATMIGGDDDEPWDAKVALRNYIADLIGQKPAEVLMHGFSRLTPFDISGRVGLDKLILPDVQEGLEGARAAESWMTAALGPVAGIGLSASKGLANIAEGNVLRGLEDMMPVSVRNPLKALRLNSEGVKDKTGIPILDDTSAMEEIGQLIGFSPSRSREAMEGKSAVYRAEHKLLDRRAALVEQWAHARQADDAEGAAEVWEQVQRFNEKNPGRRITMPNLVQSLRSRNKRIRDAEDGVYLPKKHADVRDLGRFATAGD